MNLNEIRISIIEDSQRDLCAIKKGLTKLRKNSSDKIDNENISELLIDEKDSLVNAITNLKDFNPDIIFIDLHLIDSINDGKDLIENLMSEESPLKYIPKYIISGADKVFDNGNYGELFQYAYPIKKPDMKNLEGSEEEQCSHLSEEYYALFEGKHKLNKTLPLLASMYRRVVEKFNIDQLLKGVEFKLDEAQIKQEDTMKYLQIQEKVLKKIDITTINIEEKTKLIEIMSKSIAKALPKLATKANAEKLILEWENDDDFKKAMGEYFPEEVKGLYEKIRNIAENFSETASEDIGELLYNAGKEFLEKEVKIENDDSKLVMLTKYSAYFTEKVSNFMLRQ